MHMWSKFNDLHFIPELYYSLQQLRYGARKFTQREVGGSRPTTIPMDGSTMHSSSLASSHLLHMRTDEFIKHAGKDINDLTDVTCVGVDLVNGRWWWPPAAKMWQLLLATVGICSSRRGSSAALRAYHGLVQWFDLLQRGKFAFYDSIYMESEAWNDWTVRVLPSDVLRELACSIALGPM